MTQDDKSKVDLKTWLKTYLLQVLKNKFTETILKKVLGSAMKIAGFKGWLLNFIITQLWDHVAEPMAKFGIRKGLLFYDKTRGIILVKKIKKARADNDEDDFNSGVDGIFK